MFEDSGVELQQCFDDFRKEKEHFKLKENAQADGPVHRVCLYHAHSDFLRIAEALTKRLHEEALAGVRDMQFVKRLLEEQVALQEVAGCEDRSLVLARWGRHLGQRHHRRVLSVPHSVDKESRPWICFDISMHISFPDAVQSNTQVDESVSVR